MPELLQNKTAQTFIGWKRVICTALDWKNMDRQDSVKKECEKRRTSPPKLTPLQKKLNNLITLQDE